MVILSGPMLFPLGEGPEDFVFHLFSTMRNEAAQFVHKLLLNYVAQIKKSEPTRSAIFYIMQTISYAAGKN